MTDIKRVHLAATRLEESATENPDGLGTAEDLAVATLLRAVAETHDHYRECCCGEFKAAVALADIIVAGTSAKG